MTDFDYDVLQKKRIAQQAKYRKRGSKSKKCPLNSDKLTRKQWERKNGEVVSLNVRQPMGWKDFKALPGHMQETYLKSLRDEYGASGTDLAVMFGVSPQTVRNYIQNNQFDIQLQRGGSHTAEHIRAWSDFVNGANCSVPSDSVLPELNYAEPVNASNNDDVNMSLTNISLEFDGKIDVDNVANSLRMFLDDEAYGHIQIVCSLV